MSIDYHDARVAFVCFAPSWETETDYVKVCCRFYVKSVKLIFMDEFVRRILFYMLHVVYIIHCSVVTAYDLFEFPVTYRNNIQLPLSAGLLL